MEDDKSINPLYGLGNYVNKNKIKEGGKIDVQFAEGKYLINGQPIQKSTAPSVAPKRVSASRSREASVSRDKSRSASRQSQEKSRDKSRSASRSASSGSSYVSSEGSSQQSYKRPSPKELSLNTKHRRICDKLATLKYYGATIDPDFFLIENIKRAERFIAEEEATEKLKAKLQAISGILWGTSFALEKGCMLAKLNSMEGWADAVSKDEKEYLLPAKELYDKYFEHQDSPELKFLLVYATGILRHTSANKALELLRKLEAATATRQTNQVHMRGFTDDEILG